MADAPEPRFFPINPEIFYTASLVFAAICVCGLLFVLFGIHDWHAAALSFCDTDMFAAVRVLDQYGLFDNVPMLSDGGYHIFGSTPPLPLFLSYGAFLLTGDIMTGVTLVNILAFAIIFWIFIVNAMERKFSNVVLLIVFLAFIGCMTWMSFPFPARFRSLVAIVFFVLLMHLDRKKIADWKSYLLLLFACGLSQPVIAGFVFFVMGWKLFLDKARPILILAMFAGLLLSFVLQYKLFLSGFSGIYFGSSLFHVYTFSILAVLLVFLVSCLFLLDPRKRLYAAPALLLLSLPIFNSVTFMATGDLSKTLFNVLPLSSDFVYQLFASVAFVFILFEFAEDISRNKVICGVMIFLFAASIVPYIHLIEISGANLENRLNTVRTISEESSGSKVLTMIVAVSNGKFYPIHGEFTLTSLSVLYGFNTTFIGTSLPPQADRGPIFAEPAEILRDISSSDWVDCRARVGSLKNSGVKLVVYSLFSPSNEKFGRFERDFHECGLVYLNLTGNEDASLVVYKVAD
ncbi:MAG: hypothetical protein ACP5NX_00870 [Candidatus Bilamarchaeaceae archaeon]